MKPRALFPAAIGCALLGLWLPSLWQTTEPAAKPPIVPAAPPLAGENVPASTRRGQSPLATLQALMAKPGGSFSAAEWSGTGFAEAEELARTLAGDAAGRNVKEEAVFLKMLETQDRDFVWGALQAWGEMNPDAALKSLVHMSGDRIFHRLAMIRRLAAQHPDKALAMVRTAPASPDFIHLWKAVLAGCADKDPALAVQALQSAPPVARAEGVWKVIDSLATRDPKAALALIKSLPAELRGWARPEIVYQIWSRTDPAAAMAEWEQSSGKKDPSWEIVSDWADEDPEALYQWALRKGAGVADPALHKAVVGMTWRDPDKALPMLSRLPENVRTDALPDIGAAFSARDPQAALKWLRTLTAEEQPGVLARMIPNFSDLPAEDRKILAKEAGVNTPAGFDMLYGVDRAEAQKALQAMPPAEAVPICQAMSERFLETSPSAAVPFVTAMVQALSDPAAAKALAALSGGNWSTAVDPGTSVSSSSAGDPIFLDPPEGQPKPEPKPDPATDGVMTAVAGFTTAWAAREPEAVAAWLATLPPGKAQAAAAANLAIAWGRYDLPAARAWVENLPPGEAKKGAAFQIAEIVENSGAEGKVP